jgi:hypothetical protein
MDIVRHLARLIELEQVRANLGRPDGAICVNVDSVQEPADTHELKAGVQKSMRK